MAEAAVKGQGAVEDDWAAALAEQTAAGHAPAAGAEPAAARVFQPIEAQPGAPIGMDLDRIRNIPVQLTAELGRTRITIKNLLQLSQGSVVELDGLAGQPMDVYVNGYLVAQGEVVVVNEKYGIRLTDIVAASERIQKLTNS